MGRKKLGIENDARLLSDVEKYYAAHPSGAAALRQPRIKMDRGRYVAYTGRSIKGGVIGFGTSIGSALSAFDHLCAKIGLSCPPGGGALRRRKQRPPKR